MKKISFLSMSMVLILLFASCLTGLSGRAEAETDDIDVMEVRIFLKEGKIIDVKGITRKELGENYQSTGTYNEKMDEVLDDLKEQRGIRHSMSVLFQQNSPPCSYWTFEWTKKGYKKVCLY